MTIRFRSTDFETTGTPKPDGSIKNPQKHAIVEAGWCDVIDGKEILEPVSSLCDAGKDSDVEAMAVHHITRKDCEGAPPPDRVLMRLNNEPTRPDYFVAHNIDFETIFFAGGETPWICTYKTALRIFPTAPAHKLQVLRYHLGLDDEPDFQRDLALRPHRAPDDAYVAAFLLRRLLREKDVDTLVRWSRGPALLYRVNFGKYKGRLWSELGADYSHNGGRSYLEWIVNKSDFDDRDVLATSRYYLKNPPKA